MMVHTKDLWSLVWGKPQVDPSDLAFALEEQVNRPPLDFRTRLLIRDSVEALRNYWGPKRLAGWLSHCPTREKIESISPTLREVVASHVEPVTPVVLRWQGKVSPDELAAFYEEVATQLPSRPELHIEMTVKAEIPASAVKTNVAQMEIALRRLGLDDHVTVEAA